MPSKSKLVAAAAVVAAVLPLSACGGDPTSGGGTGDSKTIIIGSANFPENELLAEIYAQALEGKDIKVQRKFNIGTRERYLKALKDGSINMLPEYNGALLAGLQGNKPIPDTITNTEQVNDALQKVLPEGTEILESSPAEDKDTLTVTSDTASKYHLKSIADLKPVAGKLAVGAGPEFKGRYQGLVGLKKVYGVDFGTFKPLDPGGPLTKGALKKDDIQVANVFSTDSDIVTNKWVVLEDPKNLFLAQNVTPIISSDQVTDTVEKTINDVSSTLNTEDLKNLVAQVQVDKKDSATVAKQYLSDHNLD